MIDATILSKMFKTDVKNVHYVEQYGYFEIKKVKIKIIIYNMKTYDYVFDLLKKHSDERKNCRVTKLSNEINHIYFNEDYIRFIIRQKILNTLIND